MIVGGHSRVTESLVELVWVCSIFSSSSSLIRVQRRNRLYHVGHMFFVVGRFHGWFFLFRGRQVEFCWNKNSQIGMCMTIVLVGLWMKGGDLGRCHSFSVGSPIHWVGTWDHRKRLCKRSSFSNFVLRVWRSFANDCVLVQFANLLDVLWRNFLGSRIIHCLGFVVFMRNRCAVVVWMFWSMRCEWCFFGNWLGRYTIWCLNLSRRGWRLSCYLLLISRGSILFGMSRSVKNISGRGLMWILLGLEDFKFPGWGLK